MKIYLYISMLILLTSLEIYADNPEVKAVEVSPSTSSADSLVFSKISGDSLDIFVDKDGDGICDDRNFRERNHEWRKSRMITQKMLNQSNVNPGKKAKLGNPGNNGHGNGPGGGQGGGG